MSKLRRVSGKETLAALERLGFVQVRQRGSHVVLRKKGTRGDVGCVVPLHKSGRGTLHNILNLAQGTEEDFIENIQIAWMVALKRRASDRKGNAQNILGARFSLSVLCY